MTSFDAIESRSNPPLRRQTFNSNDDAKLALKSGDPTRSSIDHRPRFLSSPAQTRWRKKKQNPSGQLPRSPGTGDPVRTRCSPKGQPLTKKVRRCAVDCHSAPTARSLSWRPPGSPAQFEAEYPLYSSSLQAKTDAELPCTGQA
jgi:hypothetical protein